MDGEGEPNDYSANPQGINYTMIAWLWTITKAWGFLRYARVQYGDPESNRQAWIAAPDASAEEKISGWNWGAGCSLGPAEEESATDEQMAAALGRSKAGAPAIIAALREAHLLFAKDSTEPLPPCATDMQPDTPFPDRKPGSDHLATVQIANNKLQYVLNHPVSGTGLVRPGPDLIHREVVGASTVAHGFCEDATLLDPSGATHSGREAVAAWMWDAWGGVAEEAAPLPAAEEAEPPEQQAGGLQRTGSFTLAQAAQCFPRRSVRFSGTSVTREGDVLLEASRYTVTAEAGGEGEAESASGGLLVVWAKRPMEGAEGKGKTEEWLRLKAVCS